MSDQADTTAPALPETKGEAPQAGETADAGPGGGEAAGASLRLQGPKGLGLETANVAELPDAGDYAAHEFYAANFTAAEIARCAALPAAKAAFQSLLAAKRAIVKAGAASAPAEGYKEIETGVDAEGRPVYPGCLLSVSSTGTIVAAVCLWLEGIEWPHAPGAAGQALRKTLHFKVPTRIFAFLVLLSLLTIFGFGIWKALEFLPR
jgi:phosphopantetheinyl transferase (holo-ACP synthase)